MLTFAIALVLVLIVLVFLDSYARHMGSPGPSDWVAMAVVAAIVAAMIVGAISVVGDVAQLVKGLLR